MKVGSFVFATDQGLGYLAKDFYENGVLTDVLMIRHSKRVNNFDWYPGKQNCSVSNSLIMQEFVRRQDVMLFFETPFDWNIIPYCREHGVKTVIMPMYECMPKQIPAWPDMWICPSLLDLQYFPDKESVLGKMFGEMESCSLGEHEMPKSRSVFIQVPVRAEYRERSTAYHFVHNAGNGGLKGRNGTRELLDALQYVQSPIKLTLRSQVPLDCTRVIVPNHVQLDVKIGNYPRHKLYEEGDVFIFPEKFNGLSLPLQEAYASGMVVMAGNRFPINTWLPPATLIPVSGYEKTSVSPRCVEFDSAIFNPKEIARTIDNWYGRSIEELSDSGRHWAGMNGWSRLKDKYIETLRSL